MLMTENKPYWWQQCIPRYGNWGGVGWSAGCWNNDPAVTDWSVPGIDAMDECFKSHDFAYQKNFDRDKADFKLVANLRNITVSGFRAKSYRIAAMIIFSMVPYIRWFI